MEKPRRICVVGTGMAGLVTAFLLHQDPRQRYQVEVIESETEPSLDFASVSVSNPRGGQCERIDVPMRAFTGGYYHNLRAMYDALDVSYRVQPFIFHFAKSTEPQAEAQYFVHASNIHRIPPIKPKSMRIVNYLCELVFVIFAYLWFTLCCFLLAPVAASHGQSCESLGDYLDRVWIPKHFVDFYILPLMSAVTTCSHKELLQFPARDVIEYRRLIATGWQYVVSEGVKQVQSKLTAGLSIRYSTRVVSVFRESDGTHVCWKNSAGRSMSEVFDEVILAVPPNVVSSIYLPLQKTLARIPTTTVETVVHRDDEVISDLTICDSEIKKRTLTRFGSEHDTGKTQHIYLKTSMDEVGRTEAIHSHESGAMVTSCPATHIRPEKLIRSAQFTRVLRTPESRQIVQMLFDRSPDRNLNDTKARWRNGDDGVWLVGSWCWDGMVLLEGCVVSAMRVAQAFGVEVPWSMHNSST